MEGIQIKPKRAQITLNVIALGVLCGISLAVPALAVFCALVTPLFSCPLIRHKEEAVGWLCSAVPCVSALIAGFDPFIALSFSVPALLPTAMARLTPIQKRVGAAGLAFHCAASTVGLTLTAAVFTWRLHAPLTVSLPALAVRLVESSENPGLLLYRLAANGLLAVPKNVTGNELLIHLMDQPLIREMLLSLRRTVELFAQQTLPTLFVCASLFVGVFTSLRVEHLNGVMLIVEHDPKKPHERKTRVIAPPGFRLLALPSKAHLVMTVLLVAAVIIPADGGFSQTLGAVLSGAVFGTAMLIGASVLVFKLAQRYPDREAPIGIAVGAVCLFCPMLPIMLGLCDGWFHFRSNNVRSSDSDE